MPTFSDKLTPQDMQDIRTELLEKWQDAKDAGKRKESVWRNIQRPGDIPEDEEHSPHAVDADKQEESVWRNMRRPDDIPEDEGE